MKRKLVYEIDNHRYYLALYSLDKSAYTLEITTKEVPTYYDLLPHPPVKIFKDTFLDPGSLVHTFVLRDSSSGYPYQAFPKIIQLLAKIDDRFKNPMFHVAASDYTFPSVNKRYLMREVYKYLEL